MKPHIAHRIDVTTDQIRQECFDRGHVAYVTLTDPFEGTVSHARLSARVVVDASGRRRVTWTLRTDRTYRGAPVDATTTGTFAPIRDEDE